MIVVRCDEVRELLPEGATVRCCDSCHDDEDDHGIAMCAHYAPGPDDHEIQVCCAMSMAIEDLSLEPGLDKLVRRRRLELWTDQDKANACSYGICHYCGGPRGAWKIKDRFTIACTKCGKEMK